MKEINFLGLTGSLLVLLSYSTLNGQGFMVNGSATYIGGECYQLTPDAGSLSGNIFSQNPIDLAQPFYEEATLFFGCKDNNGADGIVFILATSNTVIGGGGGGIGYQGITPSIAIEYDDYFNGNFGDPTSDHMAVISMGSVNHNMSTNLSGPDNISNIEDCMDHCFAVGWDPVTMTLTASLDDNTISYTGNIITNIFNGNALVYYGFSSGTGGLSNIHRVCFGPPALEPMQDVSVCNGGEVILEADPNGIGWEWEPDPTLSQFNISDPIATPDITTTYYVAIEYNCGFFGYDTVVVSVAPLPDIEATNNGPVCEGESISLMADGGVSYEWSGPLGFSSSVQDPELNNVNPGMSGIYTVTVTDDEGCTATTITEVLIDEGPDIIIDDPGTPFCSNIDPVQFTATPPGGEWDGEITANGLFDPDYAGEGIHHIFYTSTNALGCSNTEDIIIEVFSVQEVLIDQPGLLCESNDPVQLTGSPSGGAWEGEITVNGIFDPSDAGEGLHLITYTVIDGNDCINSAEIVVEVISVMMAEITPQGPFCGVDTITLMANPPGGTWGGAANSNGQILPFALSGGSHLVTYQLNDNNGCYEAEVYIEVYYPPDLTCPGSIQLCFNGSSVIVHADPPGGVWSGAAAPNGLVDPSTLAPGSHIAVYTDTSVICSSGGNSCWMYIEILDAPKISNITYNCDSLSAFYTVSFSISGGDTSSYMVTGAANGLLIPGLPYRFVSDPIPSGGGYSFIIDDKYHCDSDTTAGSFICNCSTNAGTMDLNLNQACENESISLMPPTGVVLGPDDTLVYVLHLGFPDSILMVSDSSVFTLIPPLQPGVTYFISSVAGNAIPGIGVDLSDPCLSVSFGTPVMWVAEPSGGIGGTAAVCEGDSASLFFFLTGTGPFDITYSDGSNTYDVNDVLPGHSISVLPSVTTVYTLTAIAETITPFCIGQPGTTHTVEVFQNFIQPLAAQICFGDSIYLGDAYHSIGGVYFDTLQSVDGCDSVLATTLTITALDTTYLTDTSCDSMQTGVFTEVFTDDNGCDSTTITTVTYVLADTTLLQSLTCDELASGVFTDVYTGQSGCDSIVIETITYVPPDSTWISGETCNPAQAGTFIEVRMNTLGCDSFIIETILLVPSDTTILNSETCDPGIAGVFTQMFTNAGGCDSLVMETIALLPSDTTVQYQYLCFSQDTGFTEQVYTNSFGCDSLLWIITSLAPEDSCLAPEIHSEVFIPNVFSPNGDGINDYFFISGHPEAITTISILRIYDRWGGLVLERINILPNVAEEGWDGKENGEPVNPGVFAWIAELKYGDGKVETLLGDVTLIR